MARPKKYDPSPTEQIEHRAIVRALASIGWEKEQIIDALDLDISVKTLERHYRSELRSSRPRTEAQIASMLVKEAVQNKDIHAARLWLHRYGSKPLHLREESTGKLSLADLMRDLD